MNRKHWPHDGVYTELRPSKINSGRVGVFAVLPVGKGVNPFPGDIAIVSVPEEKLKELGLPKAIMDLYERFGALESGQRYAPRTST